MHRAFLASATRTYGRISTGPRHRTDKRIPAWEHIASWFAVSFGDALYA